MTHHVYGRGHLGQERRLPVVVARHHLPDAHPLGVARQGSRDRPALEARLQLLRWHGMEVIVYPDRVKAELLRFPRVAGHMLVLVDGVGYVRQVEPPPLRHDRSEFDGHGVSLLLATGYWLLAICYAGICYPHHR